MVIAEFLQEALHHLMNEEKSNFISCLKKDTCVAATKHSIYRCVHYNNLPKDCYLEKDPANPCCDRPKCVFPVNYVTDVGQVHTTPAPRGGTLLRFCLEFRQIGTSQQGIPRSNCSQSEEICQYLHGCICT